MTAHNLKLSADVICVHLTKFARYKFDYVKSIAESRPKENERAVAMTTIPIKKSLGRMNYMQAWARHKASSGYINVLKKLSLVSYK